MASLGETVAALTASRWTAPAGDGAAGGLTEIHRFGDNPGALRMLVHAPAGVGFGSPLVVVMHGCTQTAGGYALGAGWVELADRYGFVLLCPEQTRANNPNLCFNWFNPSDIARGGGEAGSIYAMVRHAIGHYGLDARRVFVTGLSAGGAMANVMLATYPESFAGGAIVAGLPYGAASNMSEAFAAMRHGRSLPPGALGEAVRRASSHRGPWPRVSVWQGDEDGTVNAAVAGEIVEQWRDVHGLQASSTQPQVSERRRDTIWRNADGEAVVELHQLRGMGHGAPLGSGLAEGCGTAGPYLLEVGVSSSLEIAKSWGLVEATGSRDPAWRPPVAAEAIPLQGAHPGPAGAALSEPLRAAASGIGDVINDALRSAGLLR